MALKLMNDSSHLHPLFIVALALIGIIAFQALLLNLIAAVSGWKTLAARFRLQQPFFRSAMEMAERADAVLRGLQQLSRCRR